MYECCVGQQNLHTTVSHYWIDKPIKTIIKLLVGILQIEYFFYRYRIIKAKVREGCQSLDAADARGGQSYPSGMYLQAKTFIEGKSVRYGDPQPDCREIHLPCCVNKTTAYDDYKQEFLRNGIRCLSKRSFYRVWQEHFSNVKVRKVWS